MKKFIYTVTRTRTITERLVLDDSPKTFSKQFEANSEVEAGIMIKGMLNLRQHNKLIWQEISDVVHTPDIRIEIPVIETGEPRPRDPGVPVEPVEPVVS